MALDVISMGYTEKPTRQPQRRHTCHTPHDILYKERVVGLFFFFIILAPVIQTLARAFRGDMTSYQERKRTEQTIGRIGESTLTLRP